MSEGGFLRRRLAALGGFIGRRPGTVLLGMLAVTLLSVPLALRSARDIEKDLRKILTEGMPRAEAFKQVGRDFGIIERHFVLVELQDRSDLPAAKALADRLAELLAADRELVRYAHARYDLRRFVEEHAHLYFDPELGARLAGMFGDAGLGRAMERNREQVRLGLKDVVRADPVGLRELLPEIAARRGAGEAGLSDPDGYLVSRDGRALLVDIMATGSSGDHAFLGRMMDHSRRCLARARAEVFAGERAAAGERIRSEIGGAFAMGEQVTRVIGDGVTSSAWLSFVMVIAFLALAYLRPGAFFFIGLPMAVPIFWTLAAAPIPLQLFGCAGRLSVIGGAFCAVMLGLGSDYAVHIYNRYIGERAAGATPGAAVGASVDATGEGIVLGALTNCTAFAGMILTDFKAFREFGAMASLGIFLTMVALLLGVPASLAVLSRLRGSRDCLRQPLSFGLRPVLRLVQGRPGAVVAWGLGLFVFCVAAMFVDPAQRGVKFEVDLGKMGLPRALDPVGEINGRAAQAFGVDYQQISVVVEADTAAEVLERTAELRARALGCPRVRTVRDITLLVPAPSQQARSLELARGLPLEGLGPRLHAASAAAGLYRAPAYDEFLARIAAMAGRIRAGVRLDPERLADPLAAELAAVMFRAPDERCSRYRTHSLVLLKSYRGMDEREYAELANDLGVDGRSAQMTNLTLITYELKASVRGDLIKVTAIVGAVVMLTLLLALRRPIYVLLALCPVLLGGAAMLAVMKATSKLMVAAGTEHVLGLNYMNVLVFPVMIGIGVDNAVHLIIRARQDRLDVTETVLETGRACLVCSVTNTLGFLSMVTCPHWGIRSLGLTVALGMTFSTVASLVFVPAVLELLRRRELRKTGGAP